MHKLILIGPLLNSENSLEFEDKVIFVDGGLNFKDLVKSKEFTSIGDNDSSKTECEIKLNVYKDRSDLHHALYHNPKYQEYDLYGFLGGRLDHEFFNLGECFHFIDHLGHKTKANFYQNEELKLQILPKGKHSIIINGQFSISSLNHMKIEIAGAAKYKGSFNFSPLSSQGLSNISDGIVKINSDSTFFLFYISE